MATNATLIILISTFLIFLALVIYLTELLDSPYQVYTQVSARNPTVPVNDCTEINTYTSTICDATTVRYYKSQQFDRRLENLLKSAKSPDSYGAKHILDTLAKHTDLYIEGGVVRDLLRDQEINDIDILYTFQNKQQIAHICDELNLTCPIVYEEPEKQYVYTKFNDLIEGQTIRKINLANVENDVNCLVYDYKHKVIIDPIGTGVINNQKKQFRIVQPTFDAWFNRNDIVGKPDNKAPIRMFKMLHKGYTMEDHDGKNINSFRLWLRTNVHYMKTTNVFPDRKCPILAWVMFSTIRGDRMDYSNGSIITKGKNESKLTEVLEEIKKLDASIHIEILEYLKTYDNTL
jgi:hypothetical protein